MKFNSEEERIAYNKGIGDAIEILQGVLKANSKPLKDLEEASDIAARIVGFKEDWINEVIKSFDYDEETDVLDLFAGGGTHSMQITIYDFSQALKNSPDGGATLKDVQIEIQYDCGVLEADGCHLEIADSPREDSSLPLDLNSLFLGED